MKRLGLGLSTWLVLGGAALSGGCDNSDDGGGPQGATETNVTRLACANDAECPEGETCLFANADAGVGQCSGSGDGDATACATDDDCALGETCSDGECALPGSGGGAAGTCLAGDPNCQDLGPADQPMGGSGGPAGGTCLAGDPSCADLGPADQPTGGAASGTCLAGDPACADLGPADEPL